MDLKCQLVTRLNKEGKPYQCIVIQLTPTYEKLVFPEKAELELLNLANSSNTNNLVKPEMPFNV